MAKYFEERAERWVRPLRCIRIPCCCHTGSIRYSGLRFKINQHDFWELEFSYHCRAGRKDG